MLKKIAFSILFFLPFALQAKTNFHFLNSASECSNNTQPPAVISKCYGELQYGIASISWKTYNPDTSCIFYVERSENGKDFKDIGKIENNKSIDGVNFIFRDTQPMPTGFYRIKTISSDTIYSAIMRLSSISGMPVIKITPVVFDAQITVEVNSKINEDLNIALFNSEGKILSSRLVYTEKGINTIVFDDAISFLYADEYLMCVTGIQYAFNQKLYKK